MTHRTLTTDPEISAYLHRTRMAILDVLRHRPATVSQIATQLKVHPANLTRHMRVLEQSGLIELVEKRDTGRNLEKYYASVAETFDVAPEADATTIHKAALTMVRSDLSAALAHLPDEDPGKIYALIAHARLPSARIDHFAEELGKLIAEFQSEDTEDGEPYHLNLSLYPSDLDVAPTRSVRLEKKEKKTK